MSFLLASAARATTGARSGQEDAFRLWPAEGVAQPNGEDGGLLAVLADGMGGHTGGAVAGQTACSTFAEVFASVTTPYDQRLESALHASNEALAKGVEKNAALRGMGCTLVAAWMDTLGIRWASVGDSLLLLYRFPDVIRLNADHSLGSFLDEQVRQNRITATEARNHHNRNALRSALTGSKIDLIDLRGEPLELCAGDWILLASDGICSLQGDEIADIVYSLRQSTPAQMAEGLINAVVKKGVAGQDNATVVVVRVDEAPQAAADPSTTRAVRGGSDEELRSRRIGMTGRKATPGRKAAGRSIRSVVWWVAAAVFFLFFAVTVLLRSLPSASPPASESRKPATPEPVAVTAPEPATPDTPDTTAPDTPRPATPPTAKPPAPKSATTPDASQSVPPPDTPKGISPGPDAPKPPVPQRASPTRTPQVAPADPQPAAPAPNMQSGESQEERSRGGKVKQPSEREQPRRPKRQEQQSKEASKTTPKEAAKDAPKAAPKETLPWGFGSE